MSETPEGREIVYNITYLTGTVELKPVEYKITEVPQPAKWFGMRSSPPLYYIDSPYSRFGPFNTDKEADEMLGYMMRVSR